MVVNVLIPTYYLVSKLWGPNNLWAKPIYPWGVQRPKPRRTMAQVR